MKVDPLRRGASVEPSEGGTLTADERHPVPRLARLLASTLIRDTSAEFIVGDLDEAYRLERADGKRGSRWRYWRLALASIWARAWRAGGPGRAPGSRPAGPVGGSGGIVQDARLAVRVLRKSPGFTAIAIITLALGIGANTAVFSVVNGVLLRPLPYDRPAELINVWQVLYEWQDSDVEVFRTRADSFPASYPVFEAWQERARPFDSLVAYGDLNALVEGEELAEWVPAVESTAALFDVLGVEPALGRGFLPEEDSVGADRVVVLSHAFWMRRFGGDRSVLGSDLVLTGVPHTIIGVTPPGFYFPDRSRHLWTLLRDRARNDRWGNQSLSVVARLRDGMSIGDAQTAMDAVTLQILEDNPDSPEVGVRLVGRVDEIAGETANTLLLLMAAVALVLVVTTTNLAGLLLVRATARRQEIAIRRALGAGRLRLGTPLLIEAFVLAVAGGGLGLLGTAWGMRWIKTLLPETIPRIEDITIDVRVLAFTLLLSMSIALAFGVASAVHTGRRKLGDVLRAAGPGAVGSNRHGRSVLIVGELTVAVVLLVGATLLLTSYFKLVGVDRGFDEENILTVSIGAPLEDWSDAARLGDFHRRALEEIGALPGVGAIAAVESLPFSGGQSSASFGLVDNSEAESEGWSLENRVSTGYFDAMGIPLLRGRFFRPSDTASSARVMVINERLANEYWRDVDPLGELIWEDGVPYTIIGVAGNVKHRSLTESIERMRFRVIGQSPTIAMSFVVRTAVEPTGLAPLIRATVAELSPQATVSDIASMSSLVAETTALPRFRSLMLTGLAGVAVVLAVLGVYGVIALSVAERRREIGVRMTLGAVRADILHQVLGAGARLIVPGVLLGVATAFAAVRSIEAYVYETPVADPPTYAAVALLVALVATLATWIPARRAARIEPFIVLRGE